MHPDLHKIITEKFDHKECSGSVSRGDDDQKRAKTQQQPQTQPRGMLQQLNPRIKQNQEHKDFNLADS